MEGLIGEIRFFAGNFAPRGWALCQGQLLSIRSYTAVFSILGTVYGGDGRNTFALPNYAGRMPVGTGQATGVSQYALGEVTGIEGFTVLAANMPSHSHSITGSATLSATAADGDADTPEGNYPASLAGTDLYATASNGSFMANMQHNLATGMVGGTTAVTNLQPILGLNFVICLQGVFPQRP